MKIFHIFKRLVFRIIKGRRKHYFANNPVNLEICKPSKVRGGERISVGEHVYIGPNSQISAVCDTIPLCKHPDGKHVNQSFEPRIRIGDRVSATSGLHLSAFKEIVVGDDVMIAANVYICDGSHAYEDAHVPYKYQGISNLSPIMIKRGSWLGQNVCVMPGVTIGEFSIIGANSVVTKSVPDRCIAGGVPARVIKKWDEASKSWLSVSDKKEQ